MKNLTKSELQCIADNNNTSVMELIQERKTLINKQVKALKIISIIFIVLLSIASIIF